MYHSDTATSLVSEADANPNANASAGSDGTTCGVTGGYFDIVEDLVSLTTARLPSCGRTLRAANEAIMSTILGCIADAAAIEHGTVANFV